MYQRDNNFRLDIDNLVYAFDRNTISLCLKLCLWATLRENKDGIKMHTLLYPRGNLPVFVYLSEASAHDVKILDKLYIKPAAIYVIDLGYLHFFRIFNLIHAKRTFFVSRAKDNMQYVVESSNSTDNQTGVVSDGVVGLTSYKSR